MTPRLLLALLAVTPLAAEPGNVVVPGDSKPSAGRIDEARRRVADGKGADAVELLQAIIDSNANELALIGDGRLVSARHLAHAVVAKLPAADLAAYRKRLDSQARRWLDQADTTGEVTPLYRLVEEAFCTPQALAAIDRLGDRAFERGRFDEAEAWWRLISPLEAVEAKDKDVAALEYPDPAPGVASRAQAKQILARIYGGHLGWKVDLAKYRERHPKAAGRLAGRVGLYADTLAAVGAEPRPPYAAPDWPTLGGSPSRGRVAEAPPRPLEQLSRLGQGGPSWVFDLEGRSRIGASVEPFRKGGELDAARRLAFYPVLAGHHALVADASHITAYDLRSGRSEVWYDAVKAGVGGLFPNLSLPAPANLRYSLTVAEGCVFARLGTQTIRDVRPRPGARGDQGESVLVSLSLTPNADGSRLRWSARGFDIARKESAIFEGAPAVRDGRVWIAATRFEGDRVVTAIHCYPAHPEDSVPPLLWRTEICETRELQPENSSAAADKKQRTRHHLLTLAGSKVVYCSHSGAIVALDARTGRRAWAMRYPRRDDRTPDDVPVLRDLLPPLYADGRLFVAPADSNRVMCLDPNTGATVWERDRLDVVHLAGVGQGRLIFSTWRNPGMGRLDAGGLRAVMADTGSDAGGWVLPDDGGGLLPFGRPLLVGELVLWPTARRPYGVFAVRQRDGQQEDNPALLHRIPSGHLVFANGCLLVADGRTLNAFVPPAWLPEPEEEKVGRREPTPRPAAKVGTRRFDLVADKSRPARLDVRLEPFERFLHADDLLVCAKPNELRGRSRDGGALSWSTALAFTPTWARRLERLLVAAGEGGVAAVDAVSGEARWSFDAVSPLADFHLAGPRLVCVQGERRLLCFDATTGNLLWRRAAPGAAFEMPAPRGCVSSLTPLGDARLLVQASAYCWLLDAKSGEILSASTSPVEPWPRPPLVLGDRVCVVPNRRDVLTLDGATGRKLWSYTVPGETTRSGVPPVVVPAGESLVVVEPLNIGYRAQKLDRQTGRPLWPNRPELAIDRLDPSGWLASGETLYHAGGDQLSAWSLADARPLWKRKLPGDGPWRVAPDGRNLLVWRYRADAARFRFRWLGTALQWNVGPLPAGAAWSLLVLDAATGVLVERHELDPESLPRPTATRWNAPVSVWPALVAHRDEAGAPGPLVVRDRRGWVAAVGNRVAAFPPTSK